MPYHLTDEQLARRIRAAQELGGFSGFDALADEVAAQEGATARKRLRAIWRGRNDKGEPTRAKPSELQEIAAACQITDTFWSLDLSRPESTASAYGAGPATRQDLEGLRQEFLGLLAAHETEVTARLEEVRKATRLRPPGEQQQ